MKNKVNRREFFKLLGLSTAETNFFEKAMAAPPIVFPKENKPTFVLGPVKLNKFKEIIAICEECERSCELIVHSEDNKAIRVRMLNNNSHNNGFVCCKSIDMGENNT